MFRILTILICISWCAYLADAGPVKDSIRGGGRINFHGFRGKPKIIEKKKKEKNCNMLKTFLLYLLIYLAFKTFSKTPCQF